MIIVYIPFFFTSLLHDLRPSVFGPHIPLLPPQPIPILSLPLFSPLHPTSVSLWSLLPERQLSITITFKRKMHYDFQSKELQWTHYIPVQDYYPIYSPLLSQHHHYQYAHQYYWLIYICKNIYSGIICPYHQYINLQITSTEWEEFPFEVSSTRGEEAALVPRMASSSS